MNIENPNFKNQREQKEKTKEQFETRNFNESVWVKLTERGKEIRGGNVEVDEEGYTEMTFSDLMRDFGGDALRGAKTTDRKGKNQLPFFYDFKLKKKGE